MRRCCAIERDGDADEGNEEAEGGSEAEHDARAQFSASYASTWTSLVGKRGSAPPWRARASALESRIVPDGRGTLTMTPALLCPLPGTDERADDVDATTPGGAPFDRLAEERRWEDALFAGASEGASRVTLRCAAAEGATLVAAEGATEGGGATTRAAAAAAEGLVIAWNAAWQPQLESFRSECARREADHDCDGDCGGGDSGRGGSASAGGAKSEAVFAEVDLAGDSVARGPGDGSRGVGESSGRGAMRGAGRCCDAGVPRGAVGGVGKVFQTANELEEEEEWRMQGDWESASWEHAALAAARVSHDGAAATRRAQRA